MSSFETRINPDETKIEGISPEPQETRIESEDTLSLEELGKEYSEKLEDRNGQILGLEGEKEAIELEKERLIKEIKSFPEVYSVLDRISKLNQINVDIGSLVRKPTKKVPLKTYNMTELKKTIGKVETGELDAGYVTGVAGLRDKIEELLANK